MDWIAVNAKYIRDRSIVYEKPAFCLDVENLSLAPDGVLLEVAIVLFDLANPGSLEHAHRVQVFLDATEQILLGGHVDMSTVAWWQTPRIGKALAYQKANARDALKEGMELVSRFVTENRAALKDVGQEKIYYIARGEKDYPQLEHWMRNVGLDPVCKYNKVQDVRSMIAAYLDEPTGVFKHAGYPEWLSDAVRHTALGDALMDAYDVALARQQSCRPLVVGGASPITAMLEGVEGADLAFDAVMSHLTERYPNLNDRMDYWWRTRQLIAQPDVVEPISLHEYLTTEVPVDGCGVLMNYPETDVNRAYGWRGLIAQLGGLKTDASMGIDWQNFDSGRFEHVLHQK